MESLLHATRQYTIPVYRLPKKLDGQQGKNVRCNLEPYFSVPGHLLRDYYFSRGLLCLDAAIVEKVYAEIAKALLNSQTELVRGHVDADMEKLIQTLQTEVDVAKKKLSERGLSQGPYQRRAQARLAIITQLAASGFARDDILREWNKEGKPYSKKMINAAYKKALEEHNLKPLINSIKDTGYDELDEDAMRIFRAFMPPGTVKWGGDEKRVTPEGAIQSLVKENANER